MKMRPALVAIGVITCLIALFVFWPFDDAKEQGDAGDIAVVRGASAVPATAAVISPAGANALSADAQISDDIHKAGPGDPPAIYTAPRRP